MDTSPKHIPGHIDLGLPGKAEDASLHLLHSPISLAETESLLAEKNSLTVLVGELLLENENLRQKINQLEETLSSRCRP